MELTPDDIRRAETLAEVTSDVVQSAQLGLLARGIDDPAELVGVLLQAAWQSHKDSTGDTKRDAFAALLRSMADKVELYGKPH